MKSCRLALKFEHYMFVRQGKYAAANKILKLLLNGRLRLGLGDVDWEVDKVCERLGCPSSVSPRSGAITYHIKKLA